MTALQHRCYSSYRRSHILKRCRPLRKSRYPSDRTCTQARLVVSSRVEMEFAGRKAAAGSEGTRRKSASTDLEAQISNIPFFHLTHHCCSIHPRLTRYISSTTMFAIASSSRLTLGRLAIFAPARTRLYVAATKPPGQEASPSATSDSPSPAKAGEPRTLSPTYHMSFLLTSLYLQHSPATIFMSSGNTHARTLHPERPP